MGSQSTNRELEDVKKRNLEILLSMTCNDPAKAQQPRSGEGDEAAGKRAEGSLRRDSFSFLPRSFTAWRQLTKQKRRLRLRTNHFEQKRSKRLQMSLFYLWIDETRKQAHVVSVGTRILLRYETLLKMRSLSWYKLSVMKRKQTHSSYLNQKLLTSCLLLERVYNCYPAANLNTASMTGLTTATKQTQIAFNGWKTMRQQRQRLIMKFCNVRLKRLRTMMSSWSLAIEGDVSTDQINWFMKRFERTRMGRAYIAWKDDSFVCQRQDLWSSYMLRFQNRRFCKELLASWRRYIDQVIYLHLSLQLKFAPRILRSAFDHLLEFFFYKRISLTAAQSYTNKLKVMAFKVWKIVQTRHLHTVSEKPHPRWLQQNFLFWFGRIKFLKRSFRVVIMLRKRTLKVIYSYLSRFAKEKRELRRKLQRSRAQARRQAMSQSFHIWAMTLADRDLRAKEKLWNDLKSSRDQFFYSSNEGTNHADGLFSSIDTMMGFFITACPDCLRREHMKSFEALVASVSNVLSQSERMMPDFNNCGDERTRPEKGEACLHDLHESIEPVTAVEDSSMNSFYSSIERKSPSFEVKHAVE